MFSTLQSLSRRLVVGAAAASLLHERVSGLSTSAAAASVKAPVAARVPKAIKFGKASGRADDRKGRVEAACLAVVDVVGAESRC